MSENDAGALWQIPPSWQWTLIGDITAVVGGGTPRTNDPLNWSDADVAWVTPADLSGYTKMRIARGARNISRRGLDSSGARMLPAGTVLMSSRAPVGYVAVASGPLSTNQGFKSFVPSAAFLPEYLFYFLLGNKELVRSFASGTTFLEVSGAKAAQIPIPVAPLAEQRRIVAAIEEHLSRLDAAVSGLERVRAQLPRYRAAVLKAACEGRLVPTEAELAYSEGRAARAGSDWLLEIGVIRSEPAAASLPAGWAATRLDSLAWDADYGTSEKCDYDFNGVPVLRIPNIASGRIDLSDLKRSTRASDRTEDSEHTRPGDLLVIRTNGSRGLIGRAAVVRQEFPWPHLFASYLIRFRLRGDETLWRYVERFLESPSARVNLEGLAATTAGQYNLSLAKLGPVEVALPPKPEAAQVVDEVERLLSLADALDCAVAEGIVRANQLRKAVLEDAFSGKLVPQDPNDEPAEFLLERIRSQRTTQANNSRHVRRTARTADLEPTAQVATVTEPPPPAPRTPRSPAARRARGRNR